MPGHRCHSKSQFRASRRPHGVGWTRVLKHHPGSPDWADRDRFVLSGGHASMLLYSLLHLTGYPLSLDDIRQFRQLDSKTPGHPEYGLTPDVETTTGPFYLCHVR